ncbi:MAG: VanZ family protein [Algoriphagus sp.]|nr:VanZ family protein [Algoriphagus sp.]
MNSILKSTQLTFALFGVYLISIYWIIVLKFNISAYHDRVERSFNWIPFREFVLYGKMDFPEIILNIFIFIPFGLYAGVLLKHWGFGKKVFLFFSLSFLFEISQYIMEVGAFDITDLINNTLGGIIGLIIFMGLKKAFNSQLKAQKFINIFALIGTILIFSFLLFLKTNDLWIFRMNTIKTLGEL